MKYKIINRKKLFATMAFDLMGTAAASFFRRNRPVKISDDAINDILIIRTAYIGDVIMTLPILAPLKEKYPNARIHFLTSKQAGSLLEGHPLIDEIHCCNPFWFYKSSIKDYFYFIKHIRKKKFDLVIEARGDIRELLLIVAFLKAEMKLSYAFGGGAYLLTHVVPYRMIKHRVEYHLDLVRYLDCPITKKVGFNVTLSEVEKEQVKKILRSNAVDQPFVAVHPGSRLPLKRWPDIKCAALYDKVIEMYRIPLVILGTKQELAQVGKITELMKQKPIVLAGKLSLRELAGVLAQSELLVCNDSAPMHLAVAMRTKTVAVFGPSKSRETRPYAMNCRTVEKNFPCRYTCDESICKYDVHNACMAAIEIEDVFKEVAALLED